MAKKLIRKGQVAVMISPGYGAGWSTWNREFGDELVFDRDLALAALGESDETPEQVAARKWPEAYMGGQPVEVVWLDKGEPFVIEEYDGYESIRTSDDLMYTA